VVVYRKCENMAKLLPFSIHHQAGVEVNFRKKIVFYIYGIFAPVRGPYKYQAYGGFGSDFEYRNHKEMYVHIHFYLETTMTVSPARVTQLKEQSWEKRQQHTGS
jgi:hypothetical protein